MNGYLVLSSPHGRALSQRSPEMSWAFRLVKERSVLLPRRVAVALAAPTSFAEGQGAQARSAPCTHEAKRMSVKLGIYSIIYVMRI